MTKLTTTISSIGESVDGKNFDAQEFKIEVFYHEDKEEACVNLLGEEFSLSTMKEIVEDLEYIQKKEE